MTDEEGIKETAKILLKTLEAPIAGHPSVIVKNRTNAERLIAAAFSEVWNAKITRNDDEP